MSEHCSVSHYGLPLAPMPSRPQNATPAITSCLAALSVLAETISRANQFTNSGFTDASDHREDIVRINKPLQAQRPQVRVSSDGSAKRSVDATKATERRCNGGNRRALGRGVKRSVRKAKARECNERTPECAGTRRPAPHHSDVMKCGLSRAIAAATIRYNHAVCTCRACVATSRRS